MLFCSILGQAGRYTDLDQRRISLIDVYFGTEATLENLAPLAGVTSRERVRQLITSGMERLWESLPPELQAQFQKDKVILLKQIHSPETRAKMSEAHKGRPSPMKGRTHSEDTRAKMSEAHRRSKEA